MTRTDSSEQPAVVPRATGLRRTPIALVAVIIVTVGGGTAGALLANRSTPTPPASTPAPKQTGKPDLVGATRGPRAPDFSVRTLDGRRMTIADVRGVPTILFSFSSYDCESCLLEAQVLQQVYARFVARGLRAIAFDIDPASSPESLRSFIEQAGAIGYTVASDDHGKTALAYKVSALDTIIVIDRSGRIVYRALAPSADELSRVVSGVIA